MSQKIDLRCPECNKLLLRSEPTAAIEVVCRGCGATVEFAPSMKATVVKAGDKKQSRALIRETGRK